MNTTEIARMMHNLKKSSPALRESEQALDVWSGAPLPSGPSYGPPQSASGGGAARMIGDYSNPAPQHGATATVEQLSRDLGSVLVTMRGMEQSQKALQDIVVSLIAAKAKADAEAEDEDEDDDLRNAARRSEAKAKLRKAAKKGDTAAALRHVDTLLGSLNVINSDVQSMMGDLMTLARSGGRPIGTAAVQKCAAPFNPGDFDGGLMIRQPDGSRKNSNSLTPKLRRVVAKSGAIFEAAAKNVAMLHDAADRENGAKVLRMIESGVIADHHILCSVEGEAPAVRNALAPLFN